VDGVDGAVAGAAMGFNLKKKNVKFAKEFYTEFDNFLFAFA
jgi:hypothetical protein